MKSGYGARAPSQVPGRPPRRRLLLHHRRLPSRRRRGAPPPPPPRRLPLPPPRPLGRRLPHVRGQRRVSRRLALGVELPPPPGERGTGRSRVGWAHGRGGHQGRSGAAGAAGAGTSSINSPVGSGEGRVGRRDEEERRSCWRRCSVAVSAYSSCSANSRLVTARRSASAAITASDSCSRFRIRFCMKRGIIRGQQEREDWVPESLAGRVESHAIVSAPQQSLPRGFCTVAHDT